MGRGGAERSSWKWIPAADRPVPPESLGLHSVWMSKGKRFCGGPAAGVSQTSSLERAGAPVSFHMDPKLPSLRLGRGGGRGAKTCASVTNPGLQQEAVNRPSTRRAAALTAVWSRPPCCHAEKHGFRAHGSRRASPPCFGPSAPVLTSSEPWAPFESSNPTTRCGKGGGAGVSTLPPGLRQARQLLAGSVPQMVLIQRRVRRHVGAGVLAGGP